MAIKMLFVMYATFETVYAHIVRFLRERGCDVEMLVIANDTERESHLACQTERESHPNCQTDKIFTNRKFVRHC